MKGGPEGGRSLRIAGTEIVAGGLLAEALVPGVLTPFVAGRDAGDRPSASFVWEGSPCPEVHPFGEAGPGRTTEFARAEAGLWFRRGEALCLAAPDFSSWRAWGRRLEPHESGGSDGKPWLLLAVWALVARSGGAFLHGATCVLEGRYFLVLGHSRAGKTTMSRLVVASGGSCLTDENTFATSVATSEGKGDLFSVHGSPWPGLRGVDVPLKGPLSAVFFVRHESRNVLRRLTAAEAGERFLGNARFFNYEPAFTPLTMSLLDRMAASVPVYDLGYVPTLEAVTCLASAL